MSIWKYTLAIVDLQSVMMPAGAKILSVANQLENVCLWAMVDEKAVKTPRMIEIIGTGHVVYPANRNFIGTVICGKFVWHVFEIAGK